MADGAQLSTGHSFRGSSKYGLSTGRKSFKNSRQVSLLVTFDPAGILQEAWIL